MLDRLRAAAGDARADLRPRPSSTAAGTLGGMIGNNACGNHSVRVRAAPGTPSSPWTCCWPTAPGRGRTTRACAPPTRADADAGAALADLLRGSSRRTGPIRTGLGRIARQVSGYQLQHLLPEHGFDVARALVGTEGTCAVVLGRRCGWCPPRRAALLVARLRGHRGGRRRRARDPRLVARCRARASTRRRGDLPPARRGPAPSCPTERRGCSSSSAATDAARRRPPRGRLRPRCARGRCRLPRGHRPTPARSAVADPRGRGGPGAAAGSRRSSTAAWPGWEDAAVAPASSASYLRDFRRTDDAARLRRRALRALRRGLHARADRLRPRHRGRASRCTAGSCEEAADLVSAHGGSLSGEHGDGRARSELLAACTARRCMAAFAAFKRAFDPGSVLNPGVIVDAAHRSTRICGSDRPRPARRGRPLFSYPARPRRLRRRRAPLRRRRASAARTPAA